MLLKPLTVGEFKEYISTLIWNMSFTYFHMHTKIDFDSLICECLFKLSYVLV